MRFIPKDGEDVLVTKKGDSPNFGLTLVSIGKGVRINLDREWFK